MPGKKVEKLLRKLSQKKYRWEYGMFVAEGPKVVRELLQEGLEPEYLLTTEEAEWPGNNTIVVKNRELNSLSNLKTANGVIGIFKFPNPEVLEDHKMVLVADGVTDPGNLGTIIRCCDWFGISQIYCTTGSTDIYNAKCVQSAMGSTARVKVDYSDKDKILEQLNEFKFLVADMNGTSIYDLETQQQKIALVVGNESHGPSDFWKGKAEMITIPRHQNSRTESLNVAQATAILLSLLRRPSF